MISVEPIVEYLRRRLKEAGPRRYRAIAQEAGVAESLLPKLAGGIRDNPRVQTIQPLLDYFGAIDRGERDLPPPDIDPRYLTTGRESLASAAVESE
jgi:transcriptional regulator with XRE-family HTH domain